MARLNRQEHAGGSVTVAFLAGAMLGAAAVLLLAPQSGAQTRQLLKEYARKAEEEVNERIGTVREKFNVAKTTLDTALEQGKQFILDQKSVLTAAYEAGKEAMKKERG